MRSDYPVVLKTTVHRSNGDVSSVEVYIKTKYKNSKNHFIIFRQCNEGVKIAQHKKDYGNVHPDDTNLYAEDLETARNLAWTELDRLNLDSEKRWK